MDRVDADRSAQAVKPVRRRRRLRVLLWSGGILAVLLLIACLWHVSASRAADSQLDRLIASYRAAGQPVLLADFENPPVPDSQNAAKVYLNAGATVTLEGDAEKELASLHVSLTPAQMDLAKTILDRNAEPLRLCHQAGTMTAIDWPWRPGFDEHMMRIQMDSFKPLRTVGKLLAVAVSYHHLRGDDAAAIQTLRDGFALADALDQGHTIIDHVTALALDHFYLSKTQEILLDLKMSSSRGGADAAEIRDLIRYLLDEQAQVRCFQWALYGERAGYIYLAENLDRLYPRTLRWRVQSIVQRPWLRRGMLRVIRRYAALAQAGTKDNYFAALEVFPKQDDTQTFMEAVFLGEMGGLVVGVADVRELEFDFRTRVQRRLAATALAMKLYERDHGHPPAALADLVSDYLPAVLNDPFDPSGGPIRYAPKSRWPALYSLGTNGQDDSEARESYDPSSMARCPGDDLVFYLTVQRPLPWNPSASQAQQAAATQSSQDASGQ
jgi:hypothetical protein